MRRAGSAAARPAGDTQKSWISLETAQQRYLFIGRDLKGFMASGALKSKTGTHGAMRGIVYVSKAQCAKLREEIGFTEQEAARRAKITVPQLRDGAALASNWRGTGAIPLATVQAVIKRLHVQSRIHDRRSRQRHRQGCGIGSRTGSGTAQCARSARSTTMAASISRSR